MANQINSAVSQLENVNQQNVTLVKEYSASSYSLRDQTKALKHQVAFFKVSTFGINTPTAAPLKSAEQVFGKAALAEMTTPLFTPRPAPTTNSDDEWQEF